ncbi:hypothetical protein GDO78_015866 [Eleutherodactylus coqui]|uniref:Uncharacterized protein n=1 Tax=Eleutherodactylus coqui TaxID=57060 RepID=A0A8J6EPT2_ELECQ|nr:hypothetical protein GDO78_015866 [Eleutherodactylus coqui]
MFFVSHFFLTRASVSHFAGRFNCRHVKCALYEYGTPGYKNTLFKLQVVATKAATGEAKQNTGQQLFFYRATDHILAILCDPCFSWPRFAISCQKLILLRNFASEIGT